MHPFCLMYTETLFKSLKIFMYFFLCFIASLFYLSTDKTNTVCSQIENTL